MEQLVSRGYQVNVFDIRQSFDISDVKFFIGDLCKMEVIYFFWTSCDLMHFPVDRPCGSLSRELVCQQGCSNCIKTLIIGHVQ